MVERTSSSALSGPERIVRELQAHGWGCNTVTIPEICAAILTLKSENESLQAEVENLRKRNHDLHSNLTYNKAQVLALTERLQELDPPEEMHGT